MKRCRYFIRVNGLAASRDLAYDKALRACDQAHASRPDAVIELVQLNPADGKEIASLRVGFGAKDRANP
jgi:hypothetical protein